MSIRKLIVELLCAGCLMITACGPAPCQYERALSAYNSSYARFRNDMRNALDRARRTRTAVEYAATVRVWHLRRGAFEAEWRKRVATAARADRVLHNVCHKR